MEKFAGFLLGILIPLLFALVRWIWKRFYEEIAEIKSDFRRLKDTHIKSLHENVDTIYRQKADAAAIDRIDSRLRVDIAGVYKYIDAKDEALLEKLNATDEKLNSHMVKIEGQLGQITAGLDILMELLKHGKK